MNWFCQLDPASSFSLILPLVLIFSFRPRLSVLSTKKLWNLPEMERLSKLRLTQNNLVLSSIEISRYTMSCSDEPLRSKKRCTTNMFPIITKRGLPGPWMRCGFFAPTDTAPWGTYSTACQEVYVNIIRSLACFTFLSLSNQLIEFYGLYIYLDF